METLWEHSRKGLVGKAIEPPYRYRINEEVKVVVLGVDGGMGQPHFFINEGGWRELLKDSKTAIDWDRYEKLNKEQREFDLCEYGSEDE